MPGILLEIVVSTVEDGIAAESSGADRVELCAAIATADLTPSLGTLIEAKRRVRVPVMAMVRPRAAGFCYSEDDFAVMRRDAALLLSTARTASCSGFCIPMDAWTRSAARS